MSMETLTTALGNITNITGPELAWLVECMESEAYNLGQHAEQLEYEARQANDRMADDAREYVQRAEWKREEAKDAALLAALLATATQVDVRSEVQA